MRKLLSCLFLVSLVAFCFGQRTRPRPPTHTKIPWRYSRPRSLTAFWVGNGRCATYNVQILKGYSRRPIKTYSGVTKTRLTIFGLKKQTVYGARVQCVDKNGISSVFGIPGRSRTQGRTTKKAFNPTAPTPVGSCGVGYFTCDNGRCIPEGDWCNRVKECDSGSDERDCPGKCEAITEFHPHGNFSCSLFNSPWSACFFQCDNDFIRAGAWFTMCRRRKWTRDIPTCIMKAPSITFESVTDNSLVVAFGSMHGAEDYVFTNFKTSNGSAVATSGFNFKDISETVEVRVTGLDPDTTYLVSVAGFDTTGTRGMNSDMKSVTTKKKDSQ